MSTREENQHEPSDHLTIAPGGPRTIEVNDYSCHTTKSGQSKCKAHVYETRATDAQGNVTITLPVRKKVHSFAIYAQPTTNAAAAETAYWGIYKA